jgi:DNA-binding MarR family transcriptional regulator
MAMAPDLQTELKQTRAFPSLEEEAFLNIERTQSLLADSFEQMLKPHGITGTQYNVLRILRGAAHQGLCRNEIRDRLVSRMPDVTRLLDRMEHAGLISRTRSAEDRRLVSTQLTPEGRRLVDSLDQAVATEHKDRLGHLSGEQLRTLIDLLTEVRRTG